MNRNKTIKTGLIQSIKEIKNNNIHSLYLIGSHTDPNKDFDLTNDVDLLILTNEEINNKNYKSITHSLQEICDQYSTEIYKFEVATIHGNIKPKAQKGEIRVQLHQLTFYYNDFIEYVESGNLALHNWVLNAQTLIGTDINQLLTLPKISIEHLLNKRDSIPFFLKIINDKMYEGEKYYIKDDELIREPIKISITPHDELELFFIAINETIGSLMKYEYQENKIYDFNKRIEFLREKLDNEKYLELYKNLKQIKERLRNAKDIEFDLNYFRNQTIDILTQLAQMYKIPIKE